MSGAVFSLAAPGIVQFLQFASSCLVLSDLTQSPWHIEKKKD